MRVCKHCAREIDDTSRYWSAYVCEKNETGHEAAPKVAPIDGYGKHGDNLTVSIPVDFKVARLCSTIDSAFVHNPTGWIASVRVTRDVEGLFAFADIILSGGEVVITPDDPKHDLTPHPINRDTIVKGILSLANDPGENYRIGQLLYADDADAFTGDALLQHAAFRKMMYG